MWADLEDIGEGWFDLFLVLKPSELDDLCAHLNALASGDAEVFHWRRKAVDPKGGIADIEVTIAEECEGTVPEFDLE